MNARMSNDNIQILIKFQSHEVHFHLNLRLIANRNYISLDKVSRDSKIYWVDDVIRVLASSYVWSPVQVEDEEKVSNKQLFLAAYISWLFAPYANHFCMPSRD